MDFLEKARLRLDHWIAHNESHQEEYEKFELQRQRMESSVLRIEGDTESISIPAYQIVQVEEISMDKARSAWAAGFWGFTVFVAAMIMSTRL